MTCTIQNKHPSFPTRETVQLAVCNRNVPLATVALERVTVTSWACLAMPPAKWMLHSFLEKFQHLAITHCWCRYSPHLGPAASQSVHFILEHTIYLQRTAARRCHWRPSNHSQHNSAWISITRKAEYTKQEQCPMCTHHSVDKLFMGLRSLAIAFGFQQVVTSSLLSDPKVR